MPQISETQINFNYQIMSKDNELEFFSYLNDNELMQCAKVCKSWKLLSNKMFYYQCQKYPFHSNKVLSGPNQYDEKTNYQHIYYTISTTVSNQLFYEKIRDLLKIQHECIVIFRATGSLDSVQNTLRSMQWPLTLKRKYEWEFNAENKSYNESVNYKVIYNIFITKKFEFKSTIETYALAPYKRLHENKEMNTTTKAIIGTAYSIFAAPFAFVGSALIDTVDAPRHGINQAFNDDKMCYCCSCCRIRERAIMKIANYNYDPSDVHFLR